MVSGQMLPQVWPTKGTRRSEVGLLGQAVDYNNGVLLLGRQLRDENPPALPSNFSNSCFHRCLESGQLLCYDQMVSRENLRPLSLVQLLPGGLFLVTAGAQGTILAFVGRGPVPGSGIEDQRIECFICLQAARQGLLCLWRRSVRFA
jgi:hypothetical protein